MLGVEYGVDRAALTRRQGKRLLYVGMDTHRKVYSEPGTDKLVTDRL